MKWLFASALAETAEVAAEGAASSFSDMSLMSKGLLTTALGLAGVFLVLFIFYITIKIMQKIK